MQNSVSSHTAVGNSKFSDAALIAFLLLFVFACYANILQNSFVYDDGHQILENPYVKSWRFLPQVFGTTVWSFVGQAGVSNYYRPLMTLSCLILWQIFGPIPFGFHLFSVVVHAAVVILVFFVGRKLFNDGRVGWVAAALFAVHPIHTETVDWIAALPDLEATFFFLLALHFLSDSARSWKRTALICLCFALALLSKEPAFMFAPLAIVFEHFINQDRRTLTFSQKIFRHTPLCILALSYLAVRVLLLGKLAPVLQRPALTWPHTFYSAFAMITDYTRMLFWPSRLSVFHVFHASEAITEIRVLVGLFIVMTVTLAIFLLYKNSPSATFSLLLASLTLAPVLNARWMAGSALTERYLYLPSVGFCWFLAWLSFRFVDGNLGKSAPLRSWHWLWGTTFFLVCVSSIIATISRNKEWRSDFTLYSRTLQTDPDAHNIRANLAGVLFNSGELIGAEREWNIVLDRKPESVETMINLGRLYTREYRYPEAGIILNKAIAARPSQAESHYTKAQLLQQLGKNEAAAEEFKQAVFLAPLNPQTHYLYALQLFSMDLLPQAEAQFSEAIALGPSLPAYQGLAQIYLQRKEMAKAETALRLALTESPHDGFSHLALGKILEASGRKAEAEIEFKEVLLTDPGNTEAKQALARLHSMHNGQK